MEIPTKGAKNIKEKKQSPRNLARWKCKLEENPLHSPYAFHAQDSDIDEKLWFLRGGEPLVGTRNKKVYPSSSRSKYTNKILPNIYFKEWSKSKVSFLYIGRGDYLSYDISDLSTK